MALFSTPILFASYNDFDISDCLCLLDMSRNGNPPHQTCYLRFYPK